MRPFLFCARATIETHRGAGYPSSFLKDTWVKEKLKISTSPWVKDEKSQMEFWNPGPTTSNVYVYNLTYLFSNLGVKAFKSKAGMFNFRLFSCMSVETYIKTMKYQDIFDKISVSKNQKPYYQKCSRGLGRWILHH